MQEQKIPENIDVPEYIDVTKEPKKKQTVFLHSMEYEKLVLFLHDTTIKDYKEAIKRITQTITNYTKELIDEENETKREGLQNHVKYLTDRMETFKESLKKYDGYDEDDFINSLSKSKKAMVLKKRIKEPTDQELVAKQKRISKRRKKKGYK